MYYVCNPLCRPPFMRKEIPPFRRLNVVNSQEVFQSKIISVLNFSTGFFFLKKKRDIPLQTGCILFLGSTCVQSYACTAQRAKGLIVGQIWAQRSAVQRSLCSLNANCIAKRRTSAEVPEEGKK